MSQSLTPISGEHVDLISSCGFEETLHAFEARLGRADTGELMDRLSHASDWADYEATCSALAGSSGLIEVGRLDWGAVLTLAGTPMKACCLIIGNPLTARKLLAAGGARVGLYLPTKIIVFEGEVGDVHSPMIGSNRSWPALVPATLPPWPRPSITCSQASPPPSRRGLSRRRAKVRSVRPKQ